MKPINGNGKPHHVGLRKYSADMYQGQYYPGMHALARFIRGTGLSNKDIEENGGPAAGTLRSWGVRGKIKTRQPRVTTFMAGILAAGGRCYDPKTRRILTDEDIKA